MSQLQALLGGAAAPEPAAPAEMDLSALLGAMGGGGAAAAAPAESAEETAEDASKDMISRLLGGL